jgi:hypothetical protein
MPQRDSSVRSRQSKTSIHCHRQMLKPLVVCWVSLDSSRGARAPVGHPVFPRRLGTPSPSRLCAGSVRPFSRQVSPRQRHPSSRPGMHFRLIRKSGGDSGRSECRTTRRGQAGTYFHAWNCVHRPVGRGEFVRVRLRPVFQPSPFHASVRILEHVRQNTCEFNTPNPAFHGKNQNSRACSHKSFNC